MISLTALMLATLTDMQAQQITPTPVPTFTFIAVGDAGKPGPILTNTAKAIQTEYDRLAPLGDSVKALLFLGDNFYPNGLNNEIEIREELIEGVIGPHRPIMNKLGKENVLSVSGNHDYYCATLGPAPYGTCLSGHFYETEIPEWTYYSFFPSSVRYPTFPGSIDSVELLLFDSANLLSDHNNRDNWKPYLDSLSSLLQNSKNNPAIKWRLLFAHHSPWSAGKHAGYRIWDAKTMQVTWRGNCIEDGDDPFKYGERLFGSRQDNCDPVYKEYNDSLFAIIRRSGVTVQAMFAGHDHSLQLLNSPDIDRSPQIFVISGAGSKQDPVRSSLPPFIYTHPYNDSQNKGKSAYGFVVGQVKAEQLHLWFVNGKDGTRLTMGGVSEFVVNQAGSLIQTR